MTTTEIIKILRDTCTGKNFAPKGYADDGDYIFGFSNKHESYQLKVKTYWVIEMFGEKAYSSRENRGSSGRDFQLSLVMHPNSGLLQVSEISISPKYELGFSFGNMMLKTPISRQTSKKNPAYWEQVLPEWVFMKGDRILAFSPKKE